MKAKLTAANIARKAPAEGCLEVWDTVVPGLALRIWPTKRTYTVTTRLAGSGKQIRRRIGTPDSHTLAEARDEAREIIKAAAKGQDVASKEALREAAREAQREAERSKANGFRNVVESYLADTGRNGGANMRSKKLVEQRIENYAMPKFGDRPIADIRRSEVKDLLREIVADGKPVAANRLLGNLKLVWKWAVEADKLEISPIADLDKPADETSRDRVLTDAELADIWHGAGNLSKVHGAAIKAMLLTGARRNEAAGMKRSELSDGGKVWELPADRSKNGKPHRWPLPALAREIVASVDRIDSGDMVFTFDGETAINGWSKIKERLDRKIGEARAKAAGEPYEAEKHDLAHWTFHDLRRTLATRMHEALGVPPHIVEACIGHLSGAAKAGVAGVYNRATYWPQRVEAFERWAEYVKALTAGKPTTGIVYREPAANVTAIKRGRKAA